MIFYCKSKGTFIVSDKTAKPNSELGALCERFYVHIDIGNGMADDPKMSREQRDEGGINDVCSL